MNRINILLEYIKDDPNDEFSIYALALEYISIQDYITANKILASLLIVNENYLPLYYTWGKLKEAINETEQAINLYKKGLIVAENQKNFKTLKELKEALIVLDALDDY